MDLEQIEHFRMPGDEIVRTSPDEGILICTGGAPHTRAGNLKPVTVGRRTLAVLAVAALAAPVVAGPVFALAPETPAGASPVAYAEGSQSLVVAADLATAGVARASYAVEVIVPPPPVAIETAVAAVDGEAAGAASDDGASDDGASAGSSFVPPQGYSGENVIAYAEQFVGVVPYGTGNHPDDSFSCDGYVQYVFAGFGIELPRTANAQAALGTPIPQSEARAGDLLWWPDTHIAIYDGHGGMLDSPYWGKPVRHRVDLWDSPVFIRLNV